MMGTEVMTGGTYWYAKTLKHKTAFWKWKGLRGNPGSSQQATVYVNGKEMTYHEGGYSTFRVDITDVCKEEGDNLLVVACSNELKDSVYPQSSRFYILWRTLQGCESDQCSGCTF